MSRGTDDRDPGRVHIGLRRLDEPLLAALCDTAVAGADPLEVMPPVPGPPGWTVRRRAAFVAFHRERSVTAPRPVERTWAVVVDGEVAGAARLAPVDGGEEAGIWLARPWRGRGVGATVMRMLVERADGPVVAETTADNGAAVAVLRGLGAGVTVEGDAVHARWDRAAGRPGSDAGRAVLAAGRRHSAGLRADGTVVATGDRTGGRCDVDGWTLAVGAPGSTGGRYSPPGPG